MKSTVVGVRLRCRTPTAGRTDCGCSTAACSVPRSRGGQRKGKNHRWAARQFRGPSQVSLSLPCHCLESVCRRSRHQALVVRALPRRQLTEHSYRCSAASGFRRRTRRGYETSRNPENIEVSYPALRSGTCATTHLGSLSALMRFRATGYAPRKPQEPNGFRVDGSAETLLLASPGGSRRAVR